MTAFKLETKKKNVRRKRSGPLDQHEAMDRVGWEGLLSASFPLASELASAISSTSAVTQALKSAYAIFVFPRAASPS